ncbi:tetratricopeptide repeat protein [Rhizorhabdus argentea]|uniref:tetratricopeptide repeat protein n=1 Tax=Rhizorhabdus argentea TaxID=1387174 RepID=UPI0030ED5E16
MPPPPAGSAAHSAEMMCRELQSVIASPDFARAPIMKRLLSFLVGETVAGRGDQLKAYSVAVDGLGRAPDYDARADSYPRVQVGRLRRMLDSYYSVKPPSCGLRLTIPSGRYRVTLQPVEAAAEDAVVAPPPPVLPIAPLTFGWQAGMLIALLLLSTAALIRILPLNLSPPDIGHERPVLELGATEMAKSGELGTLARATLINGLGRSGMYDFRAQRRSGTADPLAIPARYHLATDLVGGERPRLFLRLTRLSPDRLIWSGDVSLSADQGIDSEALDQALAPAIATISRVTGVVAAHELQEHGGREATGYSCLLLYHRYRKERTDDDLDHVSTCVERSINLDPNNAELQAAAAQLSIEKMVSSDTDPAERPALLLTAQRHAQISGSIDPLNPWGNAARARIAVVRKACSQAVAFGLRAAAQQPYDPALLSDAGVYLLDCGDTRAEELIRRAIALDDNPDGRFYAPLLLLAIGRDDTRLAQEALSHMSPPLFGRHGRFYLVSAAGYAMIGDLPRARVAWTELKRIGVPIAQDPQGFLARLGYDAGIRAKALDHLRKAGLIAGR